MCDGDRGILLHEKHSDRNAHDVGAAQYHRVLALDTDTAALQQLDAALILLLMLLLLLSSSVKVICRTHNGISSGKQTNYKLN